MLEILKTNLSIFAGVVTVIGTVISVLKYTNKYQKDNAIRHNLVNLKEIFENTVSKLSSSNSSEKLSAAILLRRFFREDTVRTTKKSGSGLGLSIASHLIEIHGGSLEIESCEGVGSTFTVFLPKI